MKTKTLTTVEREHYSRCPVCGRDAHYLRIADRYCHADGSTNFDCWLALSRGVA